jgi:hypothetical protein
MAHYLQIARAAIQKSDSFWSRIATARDWSDLGAIVADAEVAFAAGTLKGVEVELLAGQCNETARNLPLCYDPCPTCAERDWWLSGWDGRTRCSACDPPAAIDQVWPPSSTETSP